MSEITSDTLVLAASVTGLEAGSIVFEFGSGEGAAIIEAHLANDGCMWTGIDCRYEALLRSRYAAARHQDLHYNPVCCLVEDVTKVFPEGCADLVLMNPPYNVSDRGRVSPESERSVARSGTGLLIYEFLRSASHLLRMGGRMVMVNRPAELCRILTGCSAAGLVPCSLQPVGEDGQPAVIVVIEARRSEQRAFELLPQRTIPEIVSGD
jgi:tRNA1Val (adenine37-N6)-methyltransferase